MGKRLLKVLLSIVALVWGIPWLGFSLFFVLAEYNRAGSLDPMEWIFGVLVGITSFPVFVVGTICFLVLNYVTTGEGKSSFLDNNVLTIIANTIALNAVFTGLFFLIVAPY